MNIHNIAVSRKKLVIVISGCLGISIIPLPQGEWTWLSCRAFAGHHLLRIKVRGISCCLVWLFACVNFFPCFAQNTAVSSATLSFCHNCNEKFGTDYLKNILSDAWQVTTSPLKWDRKDWLGFALFSSCGVLIYSGLDKEMEEYSRNIKSRTLDEFSERIGYLGHGGFIVPFWGAFYLYGGMKNNVHYKKAALVGFESYLVSGAVVTVLKFSVHRPRPNTGESYNTLKKQNFFSWSNLSFPSGHAASAFSAAAVVSWYYKDKPFIPVLSYTTAGLVALSRVNDLEHWPSDVFVGSAIGYFTAKKIIKLNENRQRTSVTFLPVQTRDYSGIMLIHAF